MHEVTHRKVFTELWFAAAAVPYSPVRIGAIVLASATFGHSELMPLLLDPRRSSRACGGHFWIRRG